MAPGEPVASPHPSPPQVRASSAGAPLAEALQLAAPALALAWLGWQRRWVAEDAFIDLRVVNHLLGGHGPVFNVGERVEAYTNPLWVALLTLAGGAGRLFSSAPLPLEWLAAALGLVCSTLGLWAATVASARSARADRSHPAAPGLLLPLGALVVVAVSPYWDFATSGLETGLSLAWIGLCVLVLTRAAGGGTRPRWPAALLIGLGPLVRPDLALLALPLLVALLAVTGRGALHRVGLAAVAAALPAAYQVFRMGYFAALVPNTAIAKEASAARWGQGLQYLLDFALAYSLWLPLTALAGWWLLDRATTARADSWRGAARLALPVGGLLHALYVVRVGGDFMHARMLLPSLFALLVPVMAVPLRSAPGRWPGVSRPALVAGSVVTLWAIVCALWLRPPYHGIGNGVGPQGIADERWFYVQFSGHPHPVTLADYDRASWKQEGEALRLRADLPDGERVVVTVKNIGLLGYAAGPRVHVVDRLGLADPIAARLRLERRGRPGHEKELADEWVAARFGAPPTPDAAPSPDVVRRVSAARAALRCGPLAELLHAVEDPLVGGRFARNLVVAAHLTTFRLAANPEAARDELCGRAKQT